VLFERCSQGDRGARESIIVEFLPYARWLARRYMGRGEPVEDLYQAASVGLIKAVDRYEPDRCESFLAFAKPTILGEIRRHFRDAAWGMHVTRAVQDRANRVARAEVELRSGSGSEPTTELIARYLRLELGQVEEAQLARSVYRPGSLDAAYVTEEGRPAARSESIGALDPGYQRVETSYRWREALQRLEPREVMVLLLRFSGEFTQDEIASRMHVSQMQVSRILRNATAALAGAPELHEHGDVVLSGAEMRPPPTPGRRQAAHRLLPLARDRSARQVVGGATATRAARSRGNRVGASRLSTPQASLRSEN
jgi:RNA polymerase sigma-B factor